MVRIAIAQMAMRGTCDENLHGVLEGLREAKALAADLVLFPECASTGYHRHLPEQISREVVRRALGRIRAECAALGVAAVVGTPFYPSAEDERIWNAAVMIDAAGRLRAVCAKAGLTPSERRFFHPGAARPRFTVGTLSCGAILCREVRDAELLRPQLQGVQLVVWPGVIAWDSGLAEPESVVTREIVSGCARTLGSHLVQCNWASSHNLPELRGMGGSLIVSPRGEVLHECPRDETGVSVVEIGGGSPIR